MTSGAKVRSGGVVLFDGTCAFCEGAVKFIARRDPTADFRFGASQSPEGTRLLARRLFADCFCPILTGCSGQ
jgi:predicted DCC family thiol-disulfide oxidoreductase YuxK